MSLSRILLVALLLAGPLAAQEPSDSAPDSVGPPSEPPVPSRLAAVEEARSRSCVGVFATLAHLDEELDPLATRAQRIQALARAMALEDSTEVAPFDEENALERTVRDWFVSDAALGRSYAESADSAVLSRRRVERETVRQQLADSLETIGARGQGIVSDAGDVQAASARCQGKILVRPAVLEVCDTLASPVCGPARSATPDASYRFVELASDLWDVEQLNPWSEPGPLARGPDGAIVGGRTAGSVRRGNMRVVVGVGYILRSRAELSAEEVAEFETNLDTLGFSFAHPDLVMAPALDILVDVPEPLAGETHYFLHFGDLSDPASQVVWTVSAARGGPIRASFPAAPAALARLQAGEALTLTAVRVEADASPDEVTEAEALYSIALTPVAQAPTVGRLLAYMASGGFGEDLVRLVPPSQGG